MRQSYWLAASLLAVALVLASSYLAVAKRPLPASLKRSSLPAAPASPADRQIRAAEKLLQRQPRLARGYNQLSAGWLQKARETGDATFNQRAEEALRHSLEISASPAENYDALRLQATLLLSAHRFAEALALGQELKQTHPRDHFVYGVLTDAYVELGQYPVAVAAADRMVELRPDATSYARIAYLRSLHGLTEPALEAMRLAVRAANPRVPEGQAWYRVQLGNELLNVGRAAEAEREFDAALLIFPTYYAALEAKARARVAAQDVPAALTYYQRALAQARQPEAYIGLGDLYAKLGQQDAAERQYLLLDASEHGLAGGTHSRQYALFLANHDRKLEEALSLMQRERAQRADVYTCDALAWVLYKLGRLEEAQAASQEALRLGTRDPQFFYHAGLIAHRLGKQAQARQWLEQALGQHPTFDVLQAEVARQTLRQLR